MRLSFSGGLKFRGTRADFTPKHLLKIGPFSVKAELLLLKFCFFSTVLK